VAVFFLWHHKVTLWPFAVIGAGAWGVTIANILAENGHNVTLWCHKKNTATHINENHQTHRLPQIKLHHSLKADSNMAHCIQNKAHVIVALPSNYLSQLEQLKSSYYPHQSITLLTKGLVSSEEGWLCHHYVEKHLRPDAIGAISGPNLALEIAEKKPAATVFASTNQDLAHDIQSALSNDFFRVYRSDDIIGVMLGGVLKNVIAIASGLLDGLALGLNARSSLITRGLQEMQRISLKFGGKSQTIYGLSGLGDLVATASSPLSRNFQLGQVLASCKNPVDTMKNNTQITEGVKTAKLIHEWAKDKALDLPIFSAVYDVVIRYEDPKTKIHELMQRKLRSEA